MKILNSFKTAYRKYLIFIQKTRKIYIIDDFNATTEDSRTLS